MGSRRDRDSKADDREGAPGPEEEFRDLMRGVGGATLIGVPLVYTMEVWDFASSISTRGIALSLTCAFVLNIGYNYLSGFRKGASLWRSVGDAVEALAIGALMAVFLLWLLGLITGDTSFGDSLRKVCLEMIPLSFGVSVANTQFSGNREEGEGGEATPPKDTVRRDVMEAGIALAGSVLFSSAIAPTEEVLRLTIQMTEWRLLLLMAVSFLLSYLILFVADFTGREARMSSKGLLQRPFGETVLAYGIALLVSFGMVIGLHGLDPAVSWYTTLAATVVLGFPAAIGGAAGRLIA